jgi:uncharacterized membrane protein
MKPHHFLKAIDHDRIVSAIAAAEKRTSGQIRVYVSHRKRVNALEFANRRFLKLKMDRTPFRNAVMIFLAPRTHKFAVVGDVAVHAKCGDGFWRSVIAAMEPLLKRGDFTEAVVVGVTKVGDVLAEHFPRWSDDRNDLSDAVVEE